MRARLLLKGILFLLVFVLLFSGVAVLDSRIRADHLVRRQKETLDAKENVSVLVLGDSHVFVGADPALLPGDWLNLAYPGDNLRDAFVKLRFAAQTKNLKTAVIGIGYHMLSTYRVPNRNVCAALRMLPPGDIRAVYQLSDLQALRQRAECAVPLLAKGVREKFMIVLVETLRTKIAAMLGGREAQNAAPALAELPVTDPSNGSLGGTIESQMGERSAEPELVRTLADIIDYGRRNGIRIVLARFPLSNQYLRGLGKYDLRPYERALREHPADAFIDFSRLFEKDQSVFRDISHLTASGARRFTRVLVRAVQALPSRRE
jgi:hypothetical protein